MIIKKIINKFFEEEIKERFDEIKELINEINENDLWYYFTGNTARKKVDGLNNGIELSKNYYQAKWSYKKEKTPNCV